MKNKLLEELNNYLPVLGALVVALLGIFIPKKLNKKEEVEADKLELERESLKKSLFDDNMGSMRENYELIVKSQKDIMENLIGEIHALKKDVVYLRKSEKKLWEENQELRNQISTLTDQLSEKVDK